MMILGVNIRKTAGEVKSYENATRSAWRFNKAKLERNIDELFILGIMSSSVVCYYRVTAINKDTVNANRVVFDVRICTEDEVRDISKRIKGQNLKGITTKIFKTN